MHQKKLIAILSGLFATTLGVAACGVETVSTHDRGDSLVEDDYVGDQGSQGGVDNGKDDDKPDDEPDTGGGTTTPGGGTDCGCTCPPEHWKDHPEAWPVLTLSLGAVVYDQTQLLAILNAPDDGNGALALAKVLIAAKLNVAAGAHLGVSAAVIVQADALLGALVVPPCGDGYLDTLLVTVLVDALIDFDLSGDDATPGTCTVH